MAERSKEVVALDSVQIIDGLKNDPLFGLSFIVQNQPNIVIDRLKGEGINVDTPDEAYNELVNLLSEDSDKAKRVLNNIPYADSVDNGTKGFSQYFNVTESDTVQTRGFNIALIGGLLAGAGALVGALSDGGLFSGSEGTAGQSQAELLALQEAERKKAEEEAKAQNRKILIGAGIFFGALIIGVLLYNSSKKTKA